MPKSRTRQPKRRPHPAGHQPRDQADASLEWSSGHDDEASALGGAHVAALLEAGQVNPDLVIEILPALLCRSDMDALTGNVSVDSSMVLQRAYAQLGIEARVCLVGVEVCDPETGESTVCAGLDPCWTDGVFDGHCVLWLPQSGRLVDPTAARFPVVRRHQRGPVVCRTGFTIGSASHVPEAHSGEMSAGTPVPVVCKSGLGVVYTVADSTYREVVTSSPLVQQASERYRRAGVNLASHVLTLLRAPTVAKRVRQAPYPQLHKLLDSVGRAEFIVDRVGDFYFTVGAGDAERSLRLDEIAAASVDPVTSRGPDRQLPHFTFDPRRIKEVMEDVDTDARVVRVPTVAMGVGDIPVVLFAPRCAVGFAPRGAVAFEAQAENIIAAGFARFSPDFTSLPQLAAWSVRRVQDGLELWDHGGIWARAVLEVDPAWLAAADEHGTVRVIYGVCVGVQDSNLGSDYSDADRDAELLDSRRAGIVAVADIPWASGPIGSQNRWWQRLRRRPSRT